MRSRPPCAGCTCASWKPGTMSAPGMLTMRVADPASARHDRRSPADRDDPPAGDGHRVRPRASAPGTPRPGGTAPTTRGRAVLPGARRHRRGPPVRARDRGRVPGRRAVPGHGGSAAVLGRGRRRRAAGPRRAPASGRASRATSAAVSARPRPGPGPPSRTCRTGRGRAGGPAPRPPPNIRRTWRFHPWASVTRYQTKRPVRARAVEQSRRAGGSPSPSRPNGDRARASLLELDPVDERGELPPAPSGFATADRVLALDRVARVQHALSPTRRRSSAGGAPPSRRPGAPPGRASPPRRGARRDEVHDGPRGMPVVDGGRHARRLVEDDVADAPSGAPTAGPSTAIAALVGSARPRGPRRLPSTVTRPAAMSSSAATPRRDAGGGEHLLDALLGHRRQPSRGSRSGTGGAPASGPSSPRPLPRPRATASCASARRPATGASSGGRSSSEARPKRSRNSIPVP